MDKRRARERAMQILYAMDVSERGYEQIGDQFDEVWEDAPVPELQFTRRLVEGTTAHREDIDAILAQYSQRWKLERLPKVDLAIFRLGLFELKWCEDIPPGATINECVELAKTYSTAKSGAFINGTLGNYHRMMLKQADAEPDEEPEEIPAAPDDEPEATAQIDGEPATQAGENPEQGRQTEPQDPSSCS